MTVRIRSSLKLTGAVSYISHGGKAIYGSGYLRRRFFSYGTYWHTAGSIT